MRKILFVVGFTLLSAFTAVHAQRAGDVVNIDQSQVSDEYAAGGSISVTTPIEGDLVVAGREIVVDGSVGGDLIAAGETIDIRQAVRDDARLAGRTITIESLVSGHVVAFGDEVEIASQAAVGEWVWVAGRNLSLNGNINGELRAAGERVFVNGIVDGDAIIRAEHVEIAATSVIRGDLIVRSEDEPVIEPGASVEGDTIVEELSGDAIGGVAGSLYTGAALILAAIAVFLLFSGFSGAVTNRTRTAPLQSLGIGIAFAILVPVLIIVLFVTGIGFLLALGTLAAYLLSLLLGTLFGLISVSGIGLRLIGDPERSKSRLVQSLAIVIGVFVVLILSQIPVLGGLVVIAIYAGGLGALMTEFWLKYRSAPS